MQMRDAGVTARQDVERNTPPRTLTLSAKERDWFAVGCLGAIALAYCVWILSLPLFPSQDGPMHLYYVRIMQALLLRRDPGIFPQYYTIKHILPPYSLYYYLLLALGHFVPLIAADKIVVCLYVALFLFGFRYLVCAIGEEGNSRALLAAPLVLNWPLCMGFVNFCLSAAFALWAMGLWCRIANRPFAPRTGLRRAGFLALAVAMMLTHPVPLLLVLGFCVVELAVRLARLKFKVSDCARGDLPQPRLPSLAAIVRDGLVLVLASTTLIYVKLFTVKHVFDQAAGAQSTLVQQIVISLRDYISLHKHSLLIFLPNDFLDKLYYLAIPLILVFGLTLSWRSLYRSLRQRIWTVANTCFALSVLLIVVLPITPPDLNGSHYFRARLVIFIWLTALAGSSTARLRDLHATFADWSARTELFSSAIFAIAATAIILTLSSLRITPISWTLAKVELSPPNFHRKVGLMLTSTDFKKPSTVTFDPYVWSSARIFRVTDSVLFNTPWLDLAIIPVGAQPSLPTGRLAPATLETMLYMRDDLDRSAAIRALIFSSIDMAVIDRGATPDNGKVDPTLLRDRVAAHHWRCAPVTIYTLCSAGHP
jgi:hypothetical protein